MTESEARMLEWGFKGLLTLFGAGVAWVFIREIKRLDARMDTEERHRDQQIAGIDGEIGSLRSRQHELGNAVAGQGGSIELMTETNARIERVLERLDQTVTDLRVLIAETRTNNVPGR